MQTKEIPTSGKEGGERNHSRNKKWSRKQGKWKKKRKRERKERKERGATVKGIGKNKKERK